MQYRLQEITEIQNQLQSGRQERGKFSIDYKNCLKAVKATEGVLAVSFIGLSTVKCHIFIYLTVDKNCLSCSYGNRSRITRSWTSFHRRRIC